MWITRKIRKHPVYSAISALVFVFIPSIIQPWWGLFSNEPMVPAISKKLQDIDMPNITFTWLYWITIPVGFGMLVYIVYTVYLTKKVNENAIFIDFNPNASPLAILKSQNISGTINKTVTCKNYSIFTFRFSESLENEDYKVRPAWTSNLEYELYGRTRKSFNIKFEEPCPNLIRLEFMF